MPSSTRLFCALCAVLCLSLLFCSLPGRAATTFTVNSLADTGDATPDGVCDDGAGNCTLREAIEEANALAGTDTIDFNIPGEGPHTIQLDSVLPELSESVDILNSSGEGITVRGEGADDPYGIFFINGGQTVNISGLTITNGRGGGTNGGGIFNDVGGTVTLADCIVSGNAADFLGGGIFNAGTLSLGTSIFSDNSPEDIVGLYTDLGGNIFI